MDDAMRCDNCRQEVTYESVRLGHDRLCEECVEEEFQSALTEIESLKDHVEKLETDWKGSEIQFKELTARADKAEAACVILRDALEEATHIVDNHVDGECEECNVACRKINAALLLYAGPAGARAAGQQPGSE
jgi:DNA replication protein DnaC